MAGKITAARQQETAAAGAAVPQMLGEAPVSKGSEGQAAGLPGDGGAAMLPGLHVRLDGSASSSKSDIAAPHVQSVVHSPDAPAAGSVAAGGATTGQQPLSNACEGAGSAADAAAFGGATCDQQSVVGPSMRAGSAAASFVAESRPCAGLAGEGCMAGRPAEAASHPDTGNVIIDMPPDGSTGQQPLQGEAWGQGQSPSAIELSVRGRQSILPLTLAPMLAGATPQAEPSAQLHELPAHPADAQANGSEPLLPGKGDTEPPAAGQDPEVCCCCA